MPLTKTDLDQIVKALDPKFEDMSLEIGKMVDNLSGDAAAFQSEIRMHFQSVERKLNEHGRLFQQVFDYVKPISTTLRTHDRRITALEAK